MTYRITIGQNQWLLTERLGQHRKEILYQVIEAHRCPQVKQGDMIKQDRVTGRLIAYSSADATRPRYRLPSHCHTEYEGYSSEEE